MKNINKTRILSLVMVLSLAVVAMFGIMMTGSKTVANAETEANVYYVSADAVYGTLGEPNNREKPYNIVTLLNRNNILNPGDTVKIIPGDYNIVNPITIRSSGSYDKYITIENDSETEQATLKFYGMEFASTNRGIQIYGNYIHWRDIDVCGAGDNGLYIGGSHNIVEDCEFYDNRDTGLQLGRSYSEYSTINEWPSYNLVKNCTSHNNYDNETYGENADGFAAKLTVGYGNVFDGCIAYRNSDDGWDLYAKTDSGNIGAVIMYNCIAFENGFLEYSQATNNAKFTRYSHTFDEADTTSFNTRDGDGNGFKLGGSVMEGDVVMVNCLSFYNKYHGVTDNSNPGVISLKGITSYDNNRNVDKNGVIVGADSTLGGGNIDVARQSYSYNNMEGILSVISAGAKNLGADAYRASVQNSILAETTSKGYKIEGALDADTKVKINGKSYSSLKDSEIFAEVAGDLSAGTFNLTGLKDMENGENRVHLKYRNADGSINLGNIFAIKDQSKLINGAVIGSDFTKSSYAEYPHFGLTNNYAACESETDAVLQVAQEVLTIPCNQSAVYQDFWVAANMMSVEITWASSDSSLAKVVEKEKEIKSASGTKFQYVVITRDTNEDKQVTLTATITSNNKSVEKQFTLNVKKDEPRIGDVFVEIGGKKLYAGDSDIVEHFNLWEEPALQVVNGANYSGSQFVLGSQYTDEVTYTYALSRQANYVEVKEFTPCNAGAWHIYHKITLKHSGETKVYDYFVYVASPVANDIAFLTDDNGNDRADVTVHANGYMVTGDVSSVTGYIYAISSANEINITSENIKETEGVVAYEFTNDRISFVFENANEDSYYVYYALGNLRGQVTSKVYSDKITKVEVSSTSDFMKVAHGKTIGKEVGSKAIYSLTKCLDFANVSWSKSSDGDNFTGYLNGNGHTVSNITVTGSGVFNKVEGGTIRNIKFDNIDVNNGTAQKTGLIGSVYGGNFYDVAITRINVESAQRSGGFIGQIFEAPVPTRIERVSVVNPIPELNEDGSVKDNGEKVYMIKANGTRASALVGYIQPSSAPVTGIEVYIKDCFTESYVTASNYSISGIVGEFDDSKALASDDTYCLDIRNCYTTSVLVATGSSSRVGGILGYHRGGGEVRIVGCFSLMQAYFAKMKVDVAQKNISAILGNFAAYGCMVTRCGAEMEEYNTDYGVTAYNLKNININIMKNIIGFSADVWDFTYAENSTSTLVAPFVVLKNSSCGC